MTQLQEDIKHHIEQQLDLDTSLSGWTYNTDMLQATNPAADYRIIVDKDSTIKHLVYRKEAV